MFVGIPDHLAHAGKGGNLLRCALRIAAGHDDLAVRILMTNPAYCGAGILIGSRGHRTGVENHNLCLRGSLGRLQPTIAELTFQSRPICLGGSTTEVLYVECRHAFCTAGPTGVLARRNPPYSYYPASGQNGRAPSGGQAEPLRLAADCAAQYSKSVFEVARPVTDV